MGSPLLSPVSTKSARLDEEGGSSNSSAGGGLGKKRDSEEAKRWQVSRFSCLEINQINMCETNILARLELHIYNRQTTEHQ